jgi:hypothetical protein
VTGRVAADPEVLRQIGYGVSALSRQAHDASTQAMTLARTTAVEVQAEKHRRMRLLEQAQAELRRAEAELSACLASRERSCAGQESAVRQLQQLERRHRTQLDVAIDALQTATRIENDTTQAARRLTSRMAAGRERAQRFLTSRGLALDAYLTGGGSAGAGGPATHGAGSGGPGTSAQGSGAERAASVGTSQLQFPAIADTGLREVPLSSIDDGDSGVTGAQSFEKASYSDVQAGLRVLHEELMPRVREGWTPEATDTSNLPPDAGAVYGHFFGETRIKLRQEADGRLSVVNGYHRIYAARAAGIQSIPAEIR